MNSTLALTGLLAFGILHMSVGFHSISASGSRTSRKPFAALPNDRMHSEMERRSAIALGLVGSMAMFGLLGPIAASAADDPTESLPPITNTVYMNVRISRQDGTFYVRDDLEDTPENQVFTGTLKLGLFGTAAPRAVQQFLSYVNVSYSPLDDDPLPSYSRSTFSSLDQATGLLLGGTIPSLEVTSFAGSTAIKYGGRILMAPLWIEPGIPVVSLKHNTKGLLTHRALDVAPSFGITTRSSTPELDGISIVFGKVLFDDSSREFFRLVEDLPTYSMEHTSTDPSSENMADTAKAAVFNSQREIFRSVARGIGDTRVSKVYEGKLLRRVEVTQVGLI